MDDPPPRSLFLGLFVMGQVLFLLVANGLQFISRSPLPDKGDYVASFQNEGRATDVTLIQNGIDAIGHLVDRYSEATGQTQAWKMFSSSLPERTLSPVVELSGSGSNCRIESNFLGRPGHNRWPSLDAREHHREFQTVMLLWERTPEWMQSSQDGDFESHRLLVNARRKSIESFLRRVANRHDSSSESGNPDSATLIARFDPKPPTNSPPDERPVCRLNFVTGEWSIYHPNEQRFIPEPP